MTTIDNAYGGVIAQRGSTDMRQSTTSSIRESNQRSYPTFIDYVLSLEQYLTNNSPIIHIKFKSVDGKSVQIDEITYYDKENKPKLFQNTRHFFYKRWQLKPYAHVDWTFTINGKTFTELTVNYETQRIHASRTTNPISNATIQSTIQCDPIVAIDPTPPSVPRC